MKLLQIQKNYLGPPGTPGVFAEYSEACSIFYKSWGVRKSIWDTKEGPQAL